MKITGRGSSIVIVMLLAVNAISPVLNCANESDVNGVTMRTMNSVGSNEETFVIIEKGTFEYFTIRSFSDVEVVYEYNAEVLLKMDLTTLESLKKQGVKVRELPKRTTLYVNDYNFDYLQGGPSIPEDLKADPNSFVSHRMFLVHFLGPIANEWIDILKAIGATIINYVPNYAYNVMMTPQQKAAVETLPFVDWVGDFHPAYKISTELETDNISISLVRSSTELETLDAISQLIKFKSTILTPDGYRIIAKAPNKDIIETIANMEDVRYIGPHFKPKLMDEVGIQITGGFWDPANPSTPYRDTGDFGAYVNHLGFTGAGVTVAIADSGIGDGTNGNAGHPDFTGRVIGGMRYEGGFRWGGVLSGGDSWLDGYGHGTHVTGLVGANGFSGTGVIYAGHGPYYVGMGLAYNATFYAQKIFDDNGDWIGPDDDNMYNIPRDGYRGGGVIHQNSWGEDVGNGLYEFVDEDFDRAARDADDTLDGNQELTIIVSAGNDGSSSNTIGSPACAKNIICVGSVRNYMPDSNSYGDSYGGGNNPDSVSSFSSRGWTDDNRIKPDVVAPGQAALSTRPPTGPTGHGVYTEDDRYMWATGTSMSAPTVSGAAAVLYEWYQTIYGIEPSPAVLKAFLINSAIDIGPPDIPNQNEGWGRVYIPTVVDPSGTWQIHDQEHELTTGMIDEFKVMYDIPTDPFKITLVYTDRYALDGDSVTLKNQVNLEVVSPGGDVYHGNAFSKGWTTANTNPNVAFDTDQDGYDDRNNVEAVYIPPGELQPGVYTVRVIGFNIVADADNDGLNDQDYALVMFNAKESVSWPYDWIPIGTDSIGDGPLGDTTLNITEIKTAYDSDYLFLRLVLEAPSPKLTDNSWWVYLDLTTGGENDWLVEERPGASGGVHSYEWSTVNGNWTLKSTSTTSDMDNDSAVRNITVNGHGCIDFALKRGDYPGLNLNAFNITAASDKLEDLNLSGDINRNPTDTSDPSCSDVAEFDDSAGPYSFINNPPTITITDNITAYEDSFYFVNYDASDSQNDSLRWSLKTNASFLSISKLTGFLKGVPTNADVGEFWVNVTVTDPGGLSDSHNFTLTVINFPPSIITDDVKVAVTDVFYSVDYYSDDDGQGIISWSLITNATWLSINTTNGIINGTPSISDLGFYWVNITVFDGNGGSDFHNFTLSVLLSYNVIRINNNVDFANQASVENWPGSGISADPYIIEGYGIDANDTGPAIYIGNTTVYFEIRGNFLYNTSEVNTPYFRGAGIQFYNVIRGLIHNNTISDNKYGVYIDQSLNSENSIMYNSISICTRYGIEIQDSGSITISKNVISQCHLSGIALYNSGNSSLMDNIILNNYYDGIRIFENSNNNIISNNTILDQGTSGISVASCQYNEVDNNTVSYTDDEGIKVYSSAYYISLRNNNISSIFLTDSYDITLANNTMIDGVFIEGDQVGHWNTHTIGTSNTLRGKPVLYWKNRNGGTVPVGAGQVILANCDNVNVENQNISLTFIGIVLAFSDNNNIDNNTLTKCKDYGIHTFSSSGNIISNNTLTKNQEGAIYIKNPTQSLGQNKIIANTISNNLGSGIFIRDADNNIITKNIIHFNSDGYAIVIRSSDSNIVSDNNVSKNRWGIYFKESDGNSIINNFVRDHSYDRGIRLDDSLSNTLSNNALEKNSILLGGPDLNYWNTHTIDTSNTVNGKPVYYWKDTNGGMVPTGAGEIILVNCMNVIIENQNISYGGSIIISFSDLNKIINNTVFYNYNGIYLNKVSENIISDNIVFNNDYGVRIISSYGDDTANNLISRNDIFYNEYGVYVKGTTNKVRHNNISHNDYGVSLTYANNNIITQNDLYINNIGVILNWNNVNNNLVYRNNFIKNAEQAVDGGKDNKWNTVYPTGGNYWSDYTGIDIYQGPNQDQAGSDGIGDTNYSIDSNSFDNYPLMKPIEYYFNLKPGWNLISIPFIQSNEDLNTVLNTIEGDYDAVQWYDATDFNDPWKHYKVGKPYGNDLSKINETMGFWINIINSNGAILMASGAKPSVTQQISLKPGWNLVGYPSLNSYNRIEGLNNLTFGMHVDAIWTYDAATQKWSELGISDYFEPGKGYWIHTKKDCIWEVPL